MGTPGKDPGLGTPSASAWFSLKAECYMQSFIWEEGWGSGGREEEKLNNTKRCYKNSHQGRYVEKDLARVFEVHLRIICLKVEWQEHFSIGPYFQVEQIRMLGEVLQTLPRV